MTDLYRRVIVGGTPQTRLLSTLSIRTCHRKYCIFELAYVRLQLVKAFEDLWGL